MMRHILTATALSVVLTSAIARAQGNAYAACREASADAFATVAGGSMFALPGVATDFVLAAGGQLIERADGTAHLSALLRRASEIDRQFLLELELSGQVLPGSPQHPPLGALPFELQAGAYVPAGPVDPAAFRFFTSGSGSLRGFGAYSGAIVDLQLSAPMQIGTGANNRNVGTGLAATFTVQVQSQPAYLTLNPTDEARLNATTAQSHAQCISHVDREDAVSAGPVRAAFALPGVGNEYVFVPTGTIAENADGTATVLGTLRREDDFEDRWELSLVLQNRVDPGDGAYPPAAGPVLALLASAYTAGGGIVEPNTFRYYGQALGTLTGAGTNAGGSISLSAARPVQIGVGANQGNRHLGLYGELQPTLVSNPTSHAIAPSGTAVLRTCIATLCVLPYPNQTPGLHFVLDNVSHEAGVMTGANLAWIEQMTIGSTTITNGQPRNWAAGYLKVISSSLIEVHPPQAMTPGTYTTRVFTRSGAGGLRQMTLNVPSTPRFRTNDDRFAFENQDLVLSQGNLAFPTIGGIFYSGSNAPTPIPGVADFAIGNAFADLNLLTLVFPDPVTKAAVFRVPSVPDTLHGFRIYFQGALIDANTAAFPAVTTDVWSTFYF